MIDWLIFRSSIFIDCSGPDLWERGGSNQYSFGHFMLLKVEIQCKFKSHSVRITKYITCISSHSNYSVGIFAFELLLHVSQEEADPGIPEKGRDCTWLVHLNFWHHCMDGDHHRCKLLGGSGPMHPKKFPFLLSKKTFQVSWRKSVKARYPCTVRSGESILWASKSKQQHSCTVVAKLGSITSCCSGKDPALLPWKHGWTLKDSFVSLNQSDNCPQIFVRHKLPCQIGLRPGMADDVELINGIQENFRGN